MAATAGTKDAAPPRRKADREPVELTIVGLGPVGQAVLGAALEDGRFSVSCCVDPREDRQDLARAKAFDGPVFESVDSIGGEGVAAVCTTSSLDTITPLILDLAKAGEDIVSTCEELVAIPPGKEEVAETLDGALRKLGRTAVGAGVNPGFVMDLLPIVCSGVTRNIQEVRIKRSTDIGKRRKRLQDKLGCGITMGEFEARREAGTIGHVGLAASIASVARSLGWNGPAVEELEPVKSPVGLEVLGIRHRARAEDESGVPRVQAVLDMYAGAQDVDRIEIDGEPPIVIELPQGVAGDEATVAAVLNACGIVRELPPGLRSVTEWQVPAWRAQ